MMLFPAAGDLLTMFVALEVLSLPLYLLCGPGPPSPPAVAGGLAQVLPARRVQLGVLPLRRRAALRLRRLALPRRHRHGGHAPPTGDLEGLLLPGVVFVLVGLLFKVGAVPFHSWTPDVYQGAPTPVTGFMAACTKVAAFGAILRVVYVGVEANRWDWRAGVIAVAALTMVVGVGAVGHPDRRQAAAGLLLDRPRRVHPRRGAGLRPDRRLGHDVLPRRLRLHDDRRLRRGVHGAPGRLRGLAPVAVGRAGAQPPGGRRRLRVPAAGLRGHPADLRLHREVCRVLARPSRSAGARAWPWSSSVCSAA